MKIKCFFMIVCLSGLTVSGCAQQTKLYIDVHHFTPGSVKFEDVAKAHQKDLAIQEKYGVSFLRYWVDEAGGNVYCLSSAPDSAGITKTHAGAHGLLPVKTYLVESGQAALSEPGSNFYFDVHQLGAGKVSAKDVEAAHSKDLAVQGKYHVNFINYWLDKKTGTVMCLSQAPDSNAVISTHKEAHGLIPAFIQQVKQGD